MSEGCRDTVILPLAGQGTRLGLPMPKELLPIGERRVALDATLDLLAPQADRLRVVAVLGEHWERREATVRHLIQVCGAWRIPLALTFQDPVWPESTGAVLSAAAWFGPATLVLLPDQVLDSPAPEAIGDIIGLIHKGSQVAFLAAREDDVDRLAVDGALRLDEQPDEPPSVGDFADKPGREAAGRFNAVWFGYAFARRSAEACVRVMHRSALRSPLSQDEREVLLGAAVVEVGRFTDLGTWPSVTGYWNRDHG
ncbi:hypothetical protein ACGFIV_32585 [Sphaerisporangium sp. NPDC049003]|uniref:hypothetical protein n=1 Tax=Sphaerisporangium sp. NPDC049003 TaxID=3364517 RepID=UPI0037138531